MENFQIQYVDISQVKPYARNPRKHPDAQIKKIARSIVKFGFDQPILVDKDFVIIKGHGRWLAAKTIPLVKVPVIVASHLSEEDVRLNRIADNKLPEYGELDEDMLKFEFGTLASVPDLDLTLSGFELDAIEKVMQDETDAVDDAGSNAKPVENQFIVSVHCKDEAQMQELFGELTRRQEYADVKLIT